MIENIFATDIRLITLYFVDARASKETLQMTLNFPAIFRINFRLIFVLIFCFFSLANCCFLQVFS